MSFRENIIKARGNLIFLAALICGLLLVTTLERNMPSTPETADGADAPTEVSAPIAIAAPITAFEEVEPLPLANTGQSKPHDLDYARIAWRYFENNTNPDTGFVNSADQYPSTTMWETGSYFIAVISADLLGIIETEEAVERLGLALDTLASIRLFDDMLPNKAYNTSTAELVDYSNQPVERGLGWSALDIARMVGAMSHAEQSYPELAAKVDAVIDHWDLDQMVENGELVGGNIAEGNLRRDQEGRVGYGQYGAKAMMLRGFDMVLAYNAEAHLMVQNVEGQPIPVDDRLHRNITPAFTVSEPYVFDGLEFGFDYRSHRFATAIYLAQ